MKNKIVFKKSDFLWSISELVAFNPDERMNWVQVNNFDKLVKSNLWVNGFNFAEGDSVLAPVYAVVNTLHNHRIGFPTMNKGYFYEIISVDFAKDLNTATALINRETTTPFIPFLYMWSWDIQAFKKVDYNIGCYRYYEDEYTSQEMRAKDFEFEFDLGIEKDYFEDADEFDLYNENEDVFIEIPDVYEFTYFKESGTTYDEKEVMKLKNINNAVDEAVYTMYELGYEETVIESSWVRMSVYADWEQFDMRKEPVEEGKVDCNDWHFKKSCYVHVLFKFTEEYKSNHSLEENLNNDLSVENVFDSDCGEKYYECRQNCDWDGDCVECQANGGCKFCDKDSILYGLVNSRNNMNEVSVEDDIDWGESLEDDDFRCPYCNGCSLTSKVETTDKKKK